MRARRDGAAGHTAARLLGAPQHVPVARRLATALAGLVPSRRLYAWGVVWQHRSLGAHGDARRGWRGIVELLGNLVLRTGADKRGRADTSRSSHP